MGSRLLQGELIADAISEESTGPRRPSTRRYRIGAAVLLVLGVAVLVINLAAPLRPAPSEIGFWTTNFERPYVHQANVRIEILASELRAARRGRRVADLDAVRASCRAVASQLAQLHDLSTPSPPQLEVRWLRVTGDDASLLSLECRQTLQGDASLRASVAHERRATAAASNGFDAFMRRHGADVVPLAS